MPPPVSTTFGTVPAACRSTSRVSSRAAAAAASTFGWACTATSGAAISAPASDGTSIGVRPRLTRPTAASASA